VAVTSLTNFGTGITQLKPIKPHTLPGQLKPNRPKQCCFVLLRKPTAVSGLIEASFAVLLAFPAVDMPTALGSLSSAANAISGSAATGVTSSFPAESDDDDADNRGGPGTMLALSEPETRARNGHGSDSNSEAARDSSDDEDLMKLVVS
jgi:hypothetical protein